MLSRDGKTAVYAAVAMPAFLPHPLILQGGRDMAVELSSVTLPLHPVSSSAELGAEQVSRHSGNDRCHCCCSPRKARVVPLNNACCALLLIATRGTLSLCGPVVCRCGVVLWRLWRLPCGCIKSYFFSRLRGCMRGPPQCVLPSRAVTMHGADCFVC
jgi:hypothetical protein